MAAGQSAPTISAQTAAISAVAGMVSSQATRMFLATPQRTAPSRRVAPAPMTAPDTTCVVLTGSASWVAPWITTAAIVCAQKPSTGSSLITFIPSVRMIRQPPA